MRALALCRLSGFQFTPPRRGRLGGLTTEMTDASYVSIHAPAQGATLAVDT